MSNGTCQHCGNERPILARGLCGTCYGALWRANELARYPASAKLGRPARKQPTPQTVKWHRLADDRRREIDRLRAEVAALRAEREEFLPIARAARRYVHVYETTSDGDEARMDAGATLWDVARRAQVEAKP